MWRCLWRNYPCSASGMKRPPLPEHVRMSTHHFVSACPVPVMEANENVLQKSGAGCPFQCLTCLRVTALGLCVAHGYCCIPAKTWQFFRRAALFIQWVKFVPPYSFHKHIVPCISAMLDATQLCPFLQRRWPQLCFLRQEQFYSASICSCTFCMLHNAVPVSVLCSQLHGHGDITGY